MIFIFVNLSVNTCVYAIFIYDLFKNCLGKFNSMLFSGDTWLCGVVKVVRKRKQQDTKITLISFEC